jgi:catechol 2,3-dioxygenase-like lactoylglutathione lyase family enzyme
VIEAIDHVQLAAPAGCEHEARRFFGEVCGLEEIPKPEPLAARGGVWFRCGAQQQLHIGVEEGFTPSRKAHPAFRVDSVAELGALAERIGDVRWDDELAGVARFYASDPFGNRLEFLATR